MTSSVFQFRELVISRDKSSLIGNCHSVYLNHLRKWTAGRTWTCMWPRTFTFKYYITLYCTLASRRNASLSPVVCLFWDICSYMVVPTYLLTLATILCSLMVADVSLDVEARANRAVKIDDDEWSFCCHSSIWTIRSKQML